VLREYKKSQGTKFAIKLKRQSAVPILEATIMIMRTVVFLLALTGVNAYVSTSFSTFTGAGTAPLLFQSTACSSRGTTLEMKKGKVNLPPQMRGNYKKQKEMMEAAEAMRAAQNPNDGFPVFNLFVRSKSTKSAGVWYPSGSFKGDDKAAALAKNYADGGFLSGISKRQLDAGVAGSLAQDTEKLEESIFRGLPQLRKSKGNLEYGYRLAFEGLSAEQKEITIIVPKKQEGGVLGGLKNAFGMS